MKSKIKTMKSRQEVTDEEIRQHMDFDKLLVQKDQYLTNLKKFSMLKKSAIALGVVVVGVTLFFILRSAEAVKPNHDKYSNDQVSSPISSNEPVIANPGEKSSELPEDKKNSLPAGKFSENQAQEKKRTVIENDVRGKEREKENSDNASGKMVYIQAEPVNGYPDLYSYFDKELTYPPAMVKDSVEGVVTVVFTINSLGKAEDVHIENSLGKSFDQEVLRVMENMPLWKPASYNGKLMKSKISLPLTFQVDKFNSKQ